MNVGMMACSDQAKEMVLKITGDDPKSPGLVTRLGAAASGGFFAAFLSLPFDLIKSRLQDGSQYKGMVDCATKVMTKEGPLAVWTGFGAYYGRCAPHAMIILLSIDEVKKVYASIFIDK